MLTTRHILQQVFLIYVYTPVLQGTSSINTGTLSICMETGCIPVATVSLVVWIADVQAAHKDRLLPEKKKLFRTAP
jgi:hypothetical protein